MKILIWGTGLVAKQILEDIKPNIEILAYIDNNNTEENFDDKKVIHPNRIDKISHDYLIIASHHYAVEIYNQLINELNYPEEKIISFGIYYDNKKYTNNFLLLNKIVNYKFKNFHEASIEPNQIAIIGKMIYDNQNKSLLTDESIYYQNDYVRYRTFELNALEIINNNIKGNVAEVGVFKGGFSKIINKIFKHKKLYLFDTFESFNKEEFDYDLNKFNQINISLDYFKNTSEKKVLEIMPFPKMCIVKKGFFPNTTEGMENERFCFVSIDVDLYKPTIKALDFFIPRLEKGGKIFIHDYNQEIYSGVKKAIIDFEKKHNLKLIKTPIPDFGGTVIISGVL